MRSSTLATIHTLEKKTELTQGLKELPTHKPWESILQKHEADYKALCQVSNDTKQWDAKTVLEKREIEAKKFVIMQQVHDMIIEQYGASNRKHAEIVAEQQKTSLWRKVLFSFLIVTDISMMSLGGYLGGVQLLTLLAPNIATLTAQLISIVATAIEGMMMYSMFKSFLEKGLGIVQEPDPNTLIEDYNRRLELTEKLNSLMINNFHYTRRQGVERYSAYSRLLKCFNQDITRTRLTSYVEPVGKKISRYFLSTINTGLNIAGAYFGSVLLLTAVSAALIGTPVGWGIIATVIVAQLLTRFFIRQNSVYDLLNPSAEQHNVVYEKLKKFTDKSDEINEDLTVMHELSNQRNANSDRLMQQNISQPIQSVTSAVSTNLFKSSPSVTVRLPEVSDQSHAADGQRMSAQ